MKTTVQCRGRSSLSAVIEAINHARYYGDVHYSISSVGLIFKDHYVEIESESTEAWNALYDLLMEIQKRYWHSPTTSTSVGTSTGTKTTT